MTIYDIVFAGILIVVLAAALGFRLRNDRDEKEWKKIKEENTKQKE